MDNHVANRLEKLPDEQNKCRSRPRNDHALAEQKRQRGAKNG
jgi:hypothetical protein